jgi:hypothetical protein
MNARADGLPRRNSHPESYGITWRLRRKPWVVKFRRNKRQIWIGSFSTFPEAQSAAQAYLAKERS